MQRFLLFLLLVGSLTTQAQQLVRFTGVVLESDTYEPVLGAAIINTTRGGGAVSDSIGFFTIEALPGDTITFRDIRFNSSQFVIPNVLKSADYGIIQVLVRSALLLDEVMVYSFPSEEDFKKAFLEIAPKPDINTLANKSTRDLMKVVQESYENERYYYENWADRRVYELTGQIPPNHFLDPIRWTNFIRDFKRQSLEK